MNIILFTLLINTIVSAEDSSDETKYIDLLPEKEKDDFLERIARRILDEVTSEDDQDGVSEEVSEASLNEHNDFVKKLINEESSNFRKNDDTAFIEKKQEQSKDNMYSLEGKAVQDKTDGDDQIDFTLRDSKRKRRNSDIENNSENSKIINIRPGILERHSSKFDGNENRLAAIITTEKNIESDSEKSKTGFLHKSSSHEGLDNISFEKFARKKPSVTDFNAKTVKIVSEDLITSSKEKERAFTTETTMINDQTKLITNMTENVKHSNVGFSKQNNEQPNKQHESVELATLTETDKRAASESEFTATTLLEPQIEKTNKMIETTTVNIENENPNLRFSRSNDDIDMTFISIELVTKHINDSFDKTTDAPIMKSKTTETTLEFGNTTDASTTISTTTLKVPEHTTHNSIIASTMKSFVTSKVSFRNADDKYVIEASNKTNNGEGTKQDHISNHLINNMLKVLRQGIKELQSNKNNFNSLHSLYETKKPKEYNVYEVPVKKNSFMQMKHHELPNKEQPHYVPIHNYSVNNAYYNSHNRYGPNADSDDGNKKDEIHAESMENERYIDSNEIVKDKHIYESNNEGSGDFNDVGRYSINDMESFGSNYYDLIQRDHRKFRFGRDKEKNKYVPYKLNLPVVVQYPKFTDLYFDSKDYLDMDYYYGRSRPKKRNQHEHKEKTNNVLPDYLERDYTSDQEQNLKNYMRAIRLLLYKQKRFGKIPSLKIRNKSVKSKVRPTKNLRSEIINTIAKQTGMGPAHSNIAMDYFFGRMSDDIDDGHDTTFGNEESPKDMKKTFHKRNIYNPPKARQDKYNIKKHFVPNEGSSIIHYKNNNYLYNDLKTATPAYDIENPIENEDHEKLINNKFDKFKPILSMTDDKDSLKTLDKPLEIDVASVNIEPYITVLRNMMSNSNKGLKQYDWLGTTVDIQAALTKLMNMMDVIQKEKHLSPPDLQLLKYCIYLHKSMKHNQYVRTKLLPRNKKKNKKIIKESGLLNRIWLYRMLGVSTYDELTEEDFKHFNEFLNDLLFYLNDLHTVVLEISSITNYKNQRWYENLEELYLDTRRKPILELLLHITTARLLDLVEESAKKDLEDDFLTYVIKNEKEVERTKEEFSIAIKIIDELKKIQFIDRNKRNTQ